MVQGTEKRKAHRAPLGTKVTWTIDNSKLLNDPSQNVSSTGMMLRTQHQVDEGTSVKLSFKLPNLKHQAPIVAEAKIMRVVQRHDRKIGIGLKFLTLSSHNYQVLQEFVCRILELPLDDSIVELKSRNPAEYTFEVARLLQKVEAQAEERKVTKEALRRKAKVRVWIRRGIRIGLILFGLFLVYKVARIIMNPSSILQ